MTEADQSMLRGRLLALRRDALARLAATDRIDTGLLRLMADRGAVLAQLDPDTDTIAKAGDRVVVRDDGRQIAVTVHSAAQPDCRHPACRAVARCRSAAVLIGELEAGKPQGPPKAEPTGGGRGGGAGKQGFRGWATGGV